jgi:hypothetical protein
MNAIKYGLGPLMGGILFAIGLGVSGMTEPAKIIGFLDLFGNWDPSLMFVMIGAIGVHGTLHLFIKKRATPRFGKEFFLPKNKKLDRSLLIGSAIFGVGWGISGLCPGPGIVSLSTGRPYALMFFGALVIGMLVAQQVARVNARKKGEA